MSVKLPMIGKKQQPKSEVSPESHKKSNNQSMNLQGSHQYQEEFDQIEEEQPQEPIETVTVLKKEKQKQQSIQGELTQSKLIEQKQSPKPQQKVQVTNKSKSALQLQKQLNDKINQVQTLKTSILDRKKQIKTINDQVDKDLNKSLFKASAKQSIVNIRDIFSASSKNSSTAMHALNEQLKKVRLTIKKVKSQIQKITDGLNNPIALLNQERGKQISIKLKEIQLQLKHYDKQKTTLNEEISRGNKEFNFQQEKSKQQQLNKCNAMLTQLTTSQKEQKAQIYQLQKEDIALMEKQKFFQQKQSQLVGLNSKRKRPETDRDKLDQEIRQVISQINNMIADRNKVQNDKKLKIKNLNVQIKASEASNWQVMQKIRDIENTLLHYYQKKSRKKQVKDNGDLSSSKMKKSKLDDSVQITPSNYESSQKSFKQTNDKNIEVQLPLVQKKKTYDFTWRQPTPQQITLSDQFLGNKMKVKKLTLIIDQHKVYRFTATYIQNGIEMKGFTMGSMEIPENHQILELQLKNDKEQYINYMHLGIQQDNFISYLQFVTSQAQQLKWGIIENLHKSEQKHVKKYESGFFKTKITKLQLQQNQQDPYFCLSGLIFSTIVLGVAK